MNEDTGPEWAHQQELEREEFEATTTAKEE